MRVTQNMYYNNIFDNNNSRLNKELFDVNKQIASGLKIQYASDNVRIFTETMRLDNEMVTIGQTKKSIESGYKVSNQTDVAMNEFTDSMNRMHTLLIQSSNDTNDNASRDAIIKELRGIESNLKSLSNTSINGQYLFSGSAVNVKPIAEDGTYKGNDVGMKAFVGSNNQQKYNITGGELFLGEESEIKREVTTNITHNGLVSGNALSSSSSLGDLMGDKDNNSSTINKNYFYIRGTKHDGTAIKEKFSLNSNATIQDLLDEIEKKYALGTVNVSLNNSGEIVIADKLNGSSKLDFHMVAAVDYSGGSAANVTNIDDLNTNGESTYPPSGNLFVQEFMKSGLDSAPGAPTKIKGIVYDRADFTKNGASLTSSIPQVMKRSHYASVNGQVINTIKNGEYNAFAKPNTLLCEVADTQTETSPSTTPKTYTIAGEELTLSGSNIGAKDYNEKISFNAIDGTNNGGVQFTLKDNITNTTSTYHVYNVDGTQVDPDKMTYQQLMDVTNLVATGTVPTADDADSYQKAVANATILGTTKLTYDGKIEFKDLTQPITKASIALYDTNTNQFDKDASFVSFNANNTLTIHDPKTDFFKTINEIIQAVESYHNTPDATSTDPANRFVGIQNAIAMMDDLQDHVFKTQSVAGAQSNTLSTALDRTSTLEISTMSLRSSVIDTDLAEASIKLSQLTLNYQALLSTVGKVSKLSLVNYL